MEKSHVVDTLGEVRHEAAHPFAGFAVLLPFPGTRHDHAGIALEEFDATGLFREKIQRKSGKKVVSFDVDAKATLPDGHEVNGLVELKRYLLTKKRQHFARAMVSRMLAYFLGRSLELSDYETVDELTAEFIKSDFKLRKLIQLISASEAFGSK